MVVFSVRVICFVAYFAPFLGLGGLMNHYKAEQTSMDYGRFLSLKTYSSNFHYWDIEQNKPMSARLTDIHRSEYVGCKYAVHWETGEWQFTCDMNIQGKVPI